MNNYCTYLRVSTQRQGAKGLGISAQRTMCENFIAQKNGVLVHEFMDVESGTHRDRKGLWDAIDYCKSNRCGLVIAKLDRLARDVEFTFKVINTGIDIHFTDMPVVNSMVLGVFAAVAQYEREMVSLRTIQALQALKARGSVKFGAANEKYIENKSKKSKEQIGKEIMLRGRMKNKRYMEAKESQMFLKALKKAFPEYCEDADFTKWDWKLGLRLRCGKLEKLVEVMKDIHDVDQTVFAKWQFDSPLLARRLRAHMQQFKKSVENYSSNN